MWDAPLPSKPFYLRVWFLSIVGILLLAAIVAVGGCLYIGKIYSAKADAFDLSKLQEMESASIVYDRNGQLLGKIYIQNRDTIPFSQVPDNLIKALIAAEDKRFYEHHGIDFMGMARAMLRNVHNGSVREGASTVTQQLARNSFPDELPSSVRSFQRKLLEAFVAMRIEKNFTKQQILEFYFNRIYFGSGFYGIEAASRGYFGKPTKELSLSECATLAGLINRPTSRSPWKDRQKCIERRNVVLDQMLELGSIDKSQHDAALADNLAVKNRGSIFTESYAIEYVRQQVASLIGDDESVYGDGYRIYTTLDSNLQLTAETSVKARLTEVEQRKVYEHLHQTYGQYDALYRNRRKRADNDPLPGPAYLQGALYALDNATGGILALVGGRDFGHNQYDRALLANRPAGTAFLPLVYAAAFEKGVFPGSLFQDNVIDNRQVMIGGLTGILGEWGPERADNQYEGPISAHYALVKSKNAATIRVGNAAGIDNVLALAKKAGIDNELRHFPATYLGSSEVTLEDLTLSYTIFPDGGNRPAKPFIVQRVQDRDGKLIYQSPALRTVQVIKPTTAYEVHSALADSLDWGSADKAFTADGLKKFPLGGKTGTAYNFTDVWFVGYSSAITCGVWAGFDSPQPIYRGAFSNDIVLPIWVDFMNASFAKFPAQEIARPTNLQRYEICHSSGLLATDKCFDVQTDAKTGQTTQQSTTYYEWGTPDQAPKDTCDIHGEGGKSYVKEFTPKEGKRAELAVDLGNFKKIPMKGTTVIGDDPYSSIKNTMVTVPEPVDPTVVRNFTATPTPTPDNGEPQVKRAEPVLPMDQQAPAQSNPELPPPPPIQF